MALKDYYESLSEKESPKTRFRNQIAASCGVTIATVFRWLSGEITPDKLKREKIAEIAGIPVERLFPKAYEEQEEQVEANQR